MSARETVVEFDPEGAAPIVLAAHPKRQKPKPQRTNTNAIMSAVFEPMVERSSVRRTSAASPVMV